jgi:surfeit locus 1 family protein
MKPRAWPVLLASVLGIAVLCSLGIWQVKRLGQKQALIAELNARMAQAPTSSGSAQEYQKIILQGELDTAHALFKVGNFRDGPGFEVLAPFKFCANADLCKVLVDLGAVPSRATKLNSITSVTGIIRLHNKGRGFFDQDNDQSTNTWFWWDLPAMYSAVGIAPAAPLSVLQALKNDSGAEAAEPKVELANNHLGYAITWFGLAAALAGVAGAFLLRKADA